MKNLSPTHIFKTNKNEQKTSKNQNKKNPTPANFTFQKRLYTQNAYMTAFVN